MVAASGMAQWNKHRPDKGITFLCIRAPSKREEGIGVAKTRSALTPISAAFVSHVTTFAGK